MKSVMISIRPKLCELIASGKKTIEIRKTRPKLETPFKCYIYCTAESYRGKYLHTSNKSGHLLMWKNPNDCNIMVEPDNYCYSAYTCRGKVIGEFVCDEIEEFTADYRTDTEKIESIADLACVEMSEIMEYGYFSDFLLAWHISDRKIYDKPKALSEFRKPCIHPKMPYCPACDVGYEYVSETEAEFYRVDGECNTEWWCLNWVKKPPKSWCYVESLEEEVEE